MTSPPFSIVSPDTRRIHVDFTGGNDANDGTLSKPLKSLLAGYNMLRDGYPDWLLLKCGEEWGLTGGSDLGYFAGWSKSGRSFQQRMIVTSYGTGALPKLNSGTHDGLQIDLASYPQHLTFSDIHFYAHTYTGAGVDPIKGISWLGTSNDISFEYVRIQAYAVGVNVQGYQTGRHTNLTFYRCTIFDCYSTEALPQPDQVNCYALLIGQTDGLTVYENIMDRNGWNTDIAGSNPTLFRRNVYINNGNTAVFFYGNICTRTDGAQIRCGGMVQENLSCQVVCGFHVGYGDVGSIEPNGVTAYLTRNVCVDGIPLNGTFLGIFGIRISNIIGGVALENLVARATTMDDPKCFWFSTIPDGLGGFVSNRIANNFRLVRNRFYEAGQITMAGNAAQYSMNSIDACLHQSATTPSNRVIEAASDGAFDAFECVVFPNKWSGGASTIFKTLSSAPPHLDITEWNGIVFGSDTVGTTNFPDPTRSPATYMGTIGFAATYAAFYTQLRLQSRQAWDDRLKAQNVNNYIRAGFGM